MLLIAVATLFSYTAAAFDTSRPEVQSFITRMGEQHQFERAALETLFRDAQCQDAILKAIARPAEKVLTWQEYRARFITDQRISQGEQFWLEHRELLDRTERAWGVPAQYILAILGVETQFGRLTGRYRVLDALATLAFDYPPRSEYFTAELEQYLLLAREESLDPLGPRGSYAGAMGPPQFMPRSIRQFAVDANGDGKRDLWEDWADIFGSIANYLVIHGWDKSEKVTVQLPREGDTESKPTGSHNFDVIMRYNKSPLYAMAVHDLAAELAKKVFADE